MMRSSINFLHGLFIDLDVFFRSTARGINWKMFCPPDSRRIGLKSHIICDFFPCMDLEVQCIPSSLVHQFLPSPMFFHVLFSAWLPRSLVVAGTVE